MLLGDPALYGRFGFVREPRCISTGALAPYFQVAGRSPTRSRTAHVGFAPAFRLARPKNSIVDPLEALEARPERVLAQRQPVARPVGDESGVAVDARRRPRVVAEIDQARARAGDCFGRRPR